MLDPKRVIQMTRMELQYQREGEVIDRFEGLDRGDYVSFQGTLAFVKGTVIYLILYAAVVAFLFVTMSVNLTELTMSLLVFGGLVGYFAFLYIYLRITHSVAVRRYNDGIRVVEQLQKDWEKLGELYEHDTHS